MDDREISRRSAFANGYVSGCIETMTMVVEILRDSSNLPHAVLRASMILKRMKNDPDELRRRIDEMIDGGSASVHDPRDAEIAQLRADLARVTAELDEAIEDRKEARDDASRAAALLVVRTLELDNARSRVVEQIKKSLPHAMQNAKAVYKYDVNESRARAMAVLIVDEAIQCLHFDDTRESIRAHAAGSGKGGTDADA